MRTMPSDNEMYDALVARDPEYVGVFLACVRTTGIFCRPTCRARKPRRENVEFVSSAAEALHAGYRPCRICRPLEDDPDQPAWASSLIDRVAADPGRRLTDADLRRASIDPEQARRYFKRRFGVTFQAFQRAWRLGSSMQRLRGGSSVTAAARRSGFESESGFRAAFERLFGTPPSDGATTGCLTARWITTPLGPVLGIASEHGLALLEFVDRRALETEISDVRRSFGQAIVPGASSHLDRIEAELDTYFRRGGHPFTVPIDTPGTPFQRAVWTALGAVPPGCTITYAALADRLGRPGAARAVGRAVGQNRLAVCVPCHRVVGADGRLTGYGGGLWRKAALLDHERGGDVVEARRRFASVGAGTPLAALDRESMTAVSSSSGRTRRSARRAARPRVARTAPADR